MLVRTSVMMMNMMMHMSAMCMLSCVQNDTVLA